MGFDYIAVFSLVFLCAAVVFKLDQYFARKEASQSIGCCKKKCKTTKKKEKKDA